MSFYVWSSFSKQSVTYVAIVKFYLYFLSFSATCSQKCHIFTFIQEFMWVLDMVLAFQWLMLLDLYFLLYFLTKFWIVNYYWDIKIKHSKILLLSYFQIFSIYTSHTFDITLFINYYRNITNFIIWFLLIVTNLNFHSTYLIK